MKRVRRYIAIALALLVAIPIIALVIGCFLWFSIQVMTQFISTISF